MVSMIELSSCTDANWAGDKETYKSISGGAVLIGHDLVKSWSKCAAPNRGIVCSV